MEKKIKKIAGGVILVSAILINCSINSYNKFQVISLNNFFLSAFAQTKEIKIDHPNAFCKSDPSKNIGYCSKLPSGGVSCTTSNASYRDCFGVGY